MYKNWGALFLIEVQDFSKWVTKLKEDIIINVYTICLHLKNSYHFEINCCHFNTLKNVNIHSASLLKNFLIYEILNK